MNTMLYYIPPTPVMGVTTTSEFRVFSVLDVCRCLIRCRIGTNLQYRFNAFSLHIKGNKSNEFVLLLRLMKGRTRSETPSNNLS